MRTSICPRLFTFLAVGIAVFVARGTIADEAPQSVVTPSGKRLALKFNDEFDAVPDKKDGKPYIDRTKWQTTFWQGSSVRFLANGEAQYYMDKDYAGRDNLALEKRPNPFSFEQPGILTISAWKMPRELWGNYWMGVERPFASGLLITDKRFVFQYGYVEGRFKLPNDRGSWPAFWLLVSNPARSSEPPKQHPWPPEIDIFEFFGHNPKKFYVNAIAPKGEKANLSKHEQLVDFNITKDFHTWSIDWDENGIVYYLDGKEIARAETGESFRQPMYLLVNLAVGGHWYSDQMKNAKTPHKPWEVDESTMPWKMQCDYVRVYQSVDAKPPTSTPPVAVAQATATKAPAKAPADGPTPYPEAKDSEWPGKGPIRVFGWMVDNRNAFWKDREKARGAVVFAGDSLTGGWKDLAAAFPGLKVANRGIGGDTSRGLLFRFKEDVLDLQPRAIVICIGSNDLSAHADPAGIEHNIRLMIKQAREQDPELPIVLCLVPPRDAKDAPTKPGALTEVNNRIKKLGADEKQLVVVDLFTPLAQADGKPKAELFAKDRIHLAGPAYKIWAEQLQPAFKELGVK